MNSKSNLKQHAAGYLRCSTDRQDYSISDQKETILEKSRQDGFEISEWFVDEGQSGVSIEKRKAFQNMMRKIESHARDWTKIYVYDFSRWGRWGDPDEAAYWEFHCKRYGVNVDYAMEDLPKGNFASALIKTVKRAEAGEFSRKLSELTTRGSRTTARNGFWNGAEAPFGYARLLVDKDGVTPIKVLKRGERKYQKEQKVKLVPGDPHEIAIIKEIFDMYVNQSMGLKLIASSFNERKIPSARGGKWGITIIHRIITNRVYIGTYIWGKNKNGKFSQSENTWNDTNTSKWLHDEEKWVVVENCHEPIIDQEIFDKAQIIRQKRDSFGTKKGQPKKDSPYLVTGLMYCKDCQNLFIGHTIKQEKRVYNYYIDAGNHYKGSANCKGLGFVPRQKIDDFVLDQIGRRIENQDWHNLVKSKLSQMLKNDDQGEDRIASIDSRIKEVNKGISNLLDLAEAGELDGEIRQRLKLRQQEKQRLEDEKQKFLKTQRNVARKENIVEEIMISFQGIGMALQSGTNDEKKQIIKTFVHKIELDKKAREAVCFFKKVPAREQLNNYVQCSHRSARRELPGIIR